MIGWRNLSIGSAFCAAACLLPTAPSLRACVVAQRTAVVALLSSQEASQTDDERAGREREREQEKRDREQEQRDREQERLERQSELYEEGREALDDERYEKAAAKFLELAKMNGAQGDAALYWKAYAENKLGKRDAALASLTELYRRYAQSRWIKDGKALEVEVRKNTGQAVNPATIEDCELKMLAMQGAMNSDPERAMPILEKFINSGASPKCKKKAVFVLAQSGSPKAREILGQIARGQSNPELQREAVQFLGLFGGERARQTLAEIYGATTDASVKRQILRSYMIAGDRVHLVAAAQTEKDEAVRGEAIRQLGLTGAQAELEQLYQKEASPQIRRELLQAFFLSGNATKLVEVAQTEKDADLRRTAIRDLGLMHSEATSQALQDLYGKEKERRIREEVLNAFFLQGNAKALIAVARKETDPELKKVAVSKLSLMGSKEATDFLMELLEK